MDSFGAFIWKNSGSGSVITTKNSGYRVKLVPIDKEYIPLFLQWFNDREITQFKMKYRPVTYEEQLSWYNDRTNNQNSVMFMIIPIDDGSEKPIGYCSLLLNLVDRIGEAGIVIGEKYMWGKGYGTESMGLLLNYAFSTRNLHRVELECYTFNKRALRLYEKLGFKSEGILRQDTYIRGCYEDVVLLGILESEWNGAERFPTLEI